MESKELLYNEAIKMIEKGDYLGAYNTLRHFLIYRTDYSKNSCIFNMYYRLNGRLNEPISIKLSSGSAI